MNQQPISSTVLEDFLESNRPVVACITINYFLGIEHLPGELLEGFLFLKEQECVLDEARRRCHKARFNYFKLLSNAGGNIQEKVSIK